jgi:hypothetical protein
MLNTLPTTENKLAFMDKSVFAQLCEQMKAGGLHLFSEIAVNQNDGPYHVPAKFAQVTSQFYWCERKQLIIVLTHNESTYGQGDEPTYLSGHWEIHAYLGFLRSWEELTNLAPNRDMSKVPFFDEKLVADTFTPKGLFYNGGSYSGMEKLIEANYSVDERLIGCTDVIGLATAAVAIKTATERYLRPLPFAELWVHSFPPFYTFKGCEKVFWSRFDKRNLRALIKRPYGSEGLER